MLVALLGGASPAVPLPPAAPAHPIHLSSTRIDVVDRTLEVVVRAFTDDLEEAMASEATVRRRFPTGVAATDAALDSAVSRHLQSRLVVSGDGGPVRLRYVGWQRVDDAIETFFEARLDRVPGEVTVEQRLLLDRFDDQQNLVFVHWGSVRRSAVLRPGRAVARLTAR
jgi:hypothetical protein